MAAKKARQKISYVLELANSSGGGHRLGVNGLAVDRDNAILYSGGRDGVVCAWDLNLDLGAPFPSKSVIDTTTTYKPPNGSAAAPTTKFRTQTQAHTHWVNDICLAQSNSALVSGSSDLTVKLWRPTSAGADGEVQEPVTLGEHADYVRCVASPSPSASWVVSGGLDRKVCLWDLSGAGKTLEIDVHGEEHSEKGSVYALAAHHSIIANGGAEASVRLWDPRTGGRITKFLGHTDLIRAILISESGDTLLTASSDQTVKVWSLAAGRCMYTMTMHDTSVWDLFSERPDLSVFYSADRAGMVAKTDVRGSASLSEMDDGISLAVAREHQGVNKVVACGGHIWTATSSSSINRWADIDTADVAAELFPDSAPAGLAISGAGLHHHQRVPSAASTVRPRSSTVQSSATGGSQNSTATKAASVLRRSVLRISNTATYSSQTVVPPVDAAGSTTTLSASAGGDAVSARKGSVVSAAVPVSAGNGENEKKEDEEEGAGSVVPVHQLPEETIEGQFGLVKHRLLNDRRRVLTLDTAGNVLLWDLIKCVPIQSFGKRHLEDVEPLVNKREAVAPWCTIDTSVGNLTVVLDLFNCFDAEMYADELELEEPIEFREDQRINLGKWILRYLFANLIDEEIRRDEAYRAKLNEAVDKRIAAAAAAQAGGRANAPSSIQLPPLNVSGLALSGDSSGATPRANGHHAPMTPGMSIGLAKPGPVTHLPGVPEGAALASPTSPYEKHSSAVSQPSVDKEDYFSSAIMSVDAPSTAAKPAAPPPKTTEGGADDKAKEGAADHGKDKDKEAANNAKSSSTTFGKKFRMGNPFGSKKLSRSASTNTEKTAAATATTTEDAKEGEGGASESSSNADKDAPLVDDSLGGVVQRLRLEYDRQVADQPDRHVESRIRPSLPSDTPVLKLPPQTKIILQEETSGGSANLYRGTVASTGADADIIERCAATWLGEVLLLNQIPPREPQKISFVLHPWQDLLPPVTTEGNGRLNANRMLRVRKILAYVAERIDPDAAASANGEGATAAAGTGADGQSALKPEDYLELYCNNELLPNTMSLAALRAHVWKSGNDILLYYRANGRKEIPTSRPAPLPGAANGAAGDGAAAGTASAPTSGITSVAGPAAAAAS